MDEIQIKASDDYICHFGRKGMKWYQHIFGKPNNVKNDRDKTSTAKAHDGPKNTNGDYVLKKGEKDFGRFSVHKGIRDGSYVFSHKWDRDTYYDAFGNTQLGDDPYKVGKAYEIKLKNIEPVKIRAAKNVVSDLINDYGEEFEKKRLNEMYKELVDLGYYDKNDQHAYYRAIDKYKERHAGEKDEEKLEAELTSYEDRINELAKENLFKKSKETIKKYRDMGYDMIPDIEDYTYAPSAAIIINARKFKVSEVIDMSDHYVI